MKKSKQSRKKNENIKKNQCFSAKKRQNNEKITKNERPPGRLFAGRIWSKSGQNPVKKRVMPTRLCFFHTSCIQLRLHSGGLFIPALHQNPARFGEGHFVKISVSRTRGTNCRGSGVPTPYKNPAQINAIIAHRLNGNQIGSLPTRVPKTIGKTPKSTWKTTPKTNGKLNEN